MSSIMSQEPPAEFKRPSRVFVSNLGWHDYTAAERYGTLVPLTEARLDYRHTDRIREQLISRLADFDPDTDYILLSGMPPLAFEIAAHLIKRFPKVKYLYWEPLMSDYLPRETSGELHNAQGK